MHGLTIRGLFVGVVAGYEGPRGKRPYERSSENIDQPIGTVAVDLPK